MIFQFEEPTQQAITRTRSGPGRPSAFAEAIPVLRQNSGKWARIEALVVKSRAADLCTRIRRGRFDGTERGEFEAVYDQVGGAWLVWARHVGTNADT